MPVKLLEFDQVFVLLFPSDIVAGHVRSGIPNESHVIEHLDSIGSHTIFGIPFVHDTQIVDPSSERLVLFALRHPAMSVLFLEFEQILELFHESFIS